MKAICIFAAWATLPGGCVRRLEVEACSQPEAIATAFAAMPRALAISARRLDATSGEDLLQLDRRAYP